MDLGKIAVVRKAYMEEVDTVVGAVKWFCPAIYQSVNSEQEDKLVLEEVVLRMVEGDGKWSDRADGKPGVQEGTKGFVWDGSHGLVKALM